MEIGEEKDIKSILYSQAYIEISINIQYNINRIYQISSHKIFFFKKVELSSYNGYFLKGTVVSYWMKSRKQNKLSTDD